jgi:hypothetical protein
MRRSQAILLTQRSMKGKTGGGSAPNSQYSAATGSSRCLSETLRSCNQVCHAAGLERNADEDLVQIGLRRVLVTKVSYKREGVLTIGYIGVATQHNTAGELLLRGADSLSTQQIAVLQRREHRQH